MIRAIFEGQPEYIYQTKEGRKNDLIWDISSIRGWGPDKGDSSSAVFQIFSDP